MICYETTDTFMQNCFAILYLTRKRHAL